VTLIQTSHSRVVSAWMALKSRRVTVETLVVSNRRESHGSFR